MICCLSSSELIHALYVIERLKKVLTREIKLLDIYSYFLKKTYFSIFKTFLGSIFIGTSDLDFKNDNTSLLAWFSDVPLRHSEVLYQAEPLSYLALAALGPVSLYKTRSCIKWYIIL